MVSNLCHRIWYVDVCQLLTPVKRIFTNLSYRFGNVDACQCLAPSKRIVSNLRHRIWYVDTCQYLTPFKRTFSNLCHRFGYNGVGAALYQAICFCFDDGVTVASRVIHFVSLCDNNACQCLALVKRMVSNLCH